MTDAIDRPKLLAYGAGALLLAVCLTWTAFVCLKHQARNPIHFAHGAVDAVVYSFTHDEPAGCGSTGTLQRHEDLGLIRCEFPLLPDWFDRRDRERGWDWAMDLLGFADVPRWVMVLRGIPNVEVTTRELLLTRHFSMPYSSRVSVVLELSEDVEATEELLDAPAQSLLEQTYRIGEIQVWLVSRGDQRYTIFEAENRLVAYDHNAAIVLGFGARR